MAAGFGGDQALEQQNGDADGDGAVGDVEHPGKVQALNIDEIDHMAEAHPVDRGCRPRRP